MLGKEVYQDFKDIFGRDIMFSDSITSNEVRVKIGETRQFGAQYGGSEVFPTFRAKYQQLVELLARNLAEFAPVNYEYQKVLLILEEESKILEPGIPPLCHVDLYFAACDPQVELVVELDRPSRPLDPGAARLTIHPNENPEVEDKSETPPRGELEHLDHSESSEVVDAADVQDLPLPSIIKTNEASEETMPPLIDELVPLATPIKGICETLVEELQRFGTDFWICEYQANVVKYHPDGTQIIDDEINVLVRSGPLPSKYLRCLVWFGLGVETSRNTLSLFFGDFLVIRSEPNPDLVGIVRLDWECLATLAAGLSEE